MSVARGKYLAFLDSDDFFEPDMLKSAYDKCELIGADVAIYRFREYDTETSRISEDSYGIYDVVVPTEDPFSVFNLQRNINKIADGIPWNKLFLHSFVLKHKLQFSETRHWNDDAFVRAALYLADRITIVNKPFVNYRIGQKTNTQSLVHKQPQSSYIATQDFIRMLKGSKRYSKIEQYAINHAFELMMSALIRYYNENQYNAYDELLQCFKLDSMMEIMSVSSNHNFYYNGWFYKLYLDTMKNSPLKIPKHKVLRGIKMFIYRIRFGGKWFIVDLYHYVSNKYAPHIKYDSP